MDREFKRSLITTFTVLLAAIILLATFTLGDILTNQSSRALRELMDEYMLSVSRAAAAMLDGDELRMLRADDKDSPEYKRTLRVLNNFRENTKLKYIYSVIDLGNGKFAFGVDPEPVDPAEFGEPVITTNALIKAAGGTPAVDEMPYEDKWGKFYSAYSPVFDSSGEVAGIVAVDFDAVWYEEKISSLIKSTFAIGSVSLIMGGVVIIIITARSRRSLRIVHRQLNELSDNVEELRKELGTDPGEEEKTERKIKRAYYEDDDLDSLGMKILDMQEELHDQITQIRIRADLDGMTGVSNKTKYLEDIKMVERWMLEGKVRYVVAVFDLISLKHYNDRYGHEAGDRAIIDAADVLIKVFGRENVYRVGGDEFIAGRSDAGEEDIKRWFSELEEELADKNKEGGLYDELPLGLSKGYAIYRPGEDKCYMDVFRRADQEMYQDKAEFYMEHGDRIRHDRMQTNDSQHETAGKNENGSEYENKI